MSDEKYYILFVNISTTGFPLSKKVTDFNFFYIFGHFFPHLMLRKVRFAFIYSGTLYTTLLNFIPMQGRKFPGVKPMMSLWIVNDYNLQFVRYLVMSGFVV